MFGDESQALLLALAQGRDSTSPHGSENRVTRPDFGMAVEQAVVHCMSRSNIGSTSVAIFFEHELRMLLRDIDGD